MSSYNHITVVGNLGRDPEINYTPQGTPVCKFPVAVNERKKVGEEWKDNPVWFRVSVWGKQAEPASQYLSKGRPCLVSGRLSMEEWVDKDGKNRVTLVITANEVVFLGDKQGSTNSDRPRATTAPQPAAVVAAISDDDIPF